MKLEKIVKDGRQRVRSLQRLRVGVRDDTTRRPLHSFQSIVGTWDEWYKTILKSLQDDSFFTI